MSESETGRGFDEFMRRACGQLDEHGRINDMALAKSAPLEELSDEILMTILYIGIERQCGAESFEAKLLNMLRNRQFRDREAQRLRHETVAASKQ